MFGSTGRNHGSFQVKSTLIFLPDPSFTSFAWSQLYKFSAWSQLYKSGGTRRSLLPFGVQPVHLDGPHRRHRPRHLLSQVCLFQCRWSLGTLMALIGRITIPTSSGLSLSQSLSSMSISMGHGQWPLVIWMAPIGTPTTTSGPLVRFLSRSTSKVTDLRSVVHW